jgi:hypothetical protein
MRRTPGWKALTAAATLAVILITAPVAQAFSPVADDDAIVAREAGWIDGLLVWLSAVLGLPVPPPEGGAPPAGQPDGSTNNGSDEGPSLDPVG